MTTKKIMQALYANSIAGIEDNYRELYSHEDWKNNNDNYSVAITQFYTNLNEDQKEKFFTIMKQIVTDSFAIAFSILDGSTTSELENEFYIVDTENNKHEFLLDYFLDVAADNGK